MALQNRVTPFGEIVATEARGTLMGNRGGRLHHNDRKELATRRWASRQWIACVLEFRGRHREVMAPNRYTELFFLDEATAFAAGHRPCAECRRADFRRFMTVWAAANPQHLPPDRPLFAGDVDAVLQRERVGLRREKPVWSASPASLPDGAFVAIDGQPWLKRADAFRLWTPAGYTDSRPLPRSPVDVLTPRSLAAALAAGYAAVLHPTADQV